MPTLPTWGWVAFFFSVGHRQPMSRGGERRLRVVLRRLLATIGAHGKMRNGVTPTPTRRLRVLRLLWLDTRENRRSASSSQGAVLAREPTLGISAFCRSTGAPAGPVSRAPGAAVWRTGAAAGRGRDQAAALAGCAALATRASIAAALRCRICSRASSPICASASAFLVQSQPNSVPSVPHTIRSAP